MNFNPLGLIIYPIWAVIGLFFWIAILARAVGYYSVGMMAAIISGGDTRGMSNILNEATVFYVKGFAQIQRSFEAEDLSTSSSPISFGRFVGECFWALFFWGFSIFIVASRAELIDEIKSASSWVKSAINGEGYGYDTYNYDNGYDYGKDGTSLRLK